ncbi:MAG: HEAT repeat domain-containing protein [Methanoregula sp.]|jgi:HEAT repeat protein
MTPIEGLRQSRDIRGLVRLLDHGNSDIQWQAADALGTLGEQACDPLIRILSFPKVHVRLGAIEALGEIKCPRSIDPLIHNLKTDPDNEVRFVAALVLGQIGDSHAVPALCEALMDGDRYVRYGAIKSLEQLNWKPENEIIKTYSLIAAQEWQDIHKMGHAAVEPLVQTCRDINPATRVHCVELLGEIGGPDAKKACESALMDRDPEVRWSAVLACRKCGVDSTLIPIILSDRPRTTPNPFGAAILNFFFFGLGYNYIGKWWGFPVFMSYMTLLVLVQLQWGLLLPYLCVFPFTAVSAVMTYYTVKKIPDM